MTDYRDFLKSNLRKVRLACGYTQDNVAGALGVVRSTYTYYETGVTSPDIETLRKLSKIFGISLLQLVLPEEGPDVNPGRLRVKHHPVEDPQTIGQLTDEEKTIIARRRAGEA